jgi:hypothetical protein
VNRKPTGRAEGYIKTDKLGRASRIVSHPDFTNIEIKPSVVTNDSHFSVRSDYFNEEQNQRGSKN